MGLNKFDKYTAIIFLCLAFVTLLLSGITANADTRTYSTANDYLKYFPKPGNNQQRVVILLAKLDNEPDFLVELIPGVIVEADANDPNHFFVKAKLARKIVKGWQFNYYELQSNIDKISATLIGFEHAGRKKEVFAYAMDKGEEGLLSKGVYVRYNSQVPIVIYVPMGFEVRYRILKTYGETGKAKSE